MLNIPPTGQVLIFWACFLGLGALILHFDHRYKMLRDTSIAEKKSFSFARVQLAWWTTIVLSSFFTIVIAHFPSIPTFHESTLVLLGISAATTGAARIIDQSDQKLPPAMIAQNQPGEDFFLDILSDGTGPNLHRFQTVVFNLSFGLWFIASFLHNLLDLKFTCPAGAPAGATAIDCLIPIISTNNLILLGLSAGTYAALKTTENKPNAATLADTVADESGNGGSGPAQG